MAILAGALWAFARRSALDWNGPEADAEIKTAVDDALEDLARHRRWSWLTKTASLVLTAPYATGQLSATAGNATLTFTGGGVPPSWVLNGRLLINGAIFEIASTNGTTTIALDVPWPFATGAYDYQLVRDRYPLPARMVQFLALFPGHNWMWGMSPVTPEVILTAQADSDRTAPHPEAWAIDGNDLIVYPFPSQVATARIRYYSLPALTVDADEDDEVEWDDNQRAVLHAAITHYIGLRTGKTVIGGPVQTLVAYDRAMAKAISMDNSAPEQVSPLVAGNSLPRHPLERYWNAR
jgi:hypothetical protein